MESSRNDPEQEWVRRTGQAWQLRALDYYSQIGEVRYGCSFYSRMMKRLRIFPATLDQLEQPKAILTGPPVDVLDRIRDPGGGRSKILGDYGRLMFAVGEGYLFGRNLNTPDEKWSFVWRGELDFSDDTKIIWRPAGSLMYTFERDTEATAYRMWTPHPMFSYEADAPMLGVLDICEELLILTKSVRATATSRIARNGVLLIPNEIAPPPVDPGEDEDMLSDPLMQDFVDHATATLEGIGTAASTLQLLMYGAGEYLEKVRHIKFHDSLDDYAEKELRTEAIKRLALGFDMPPEELLGMANANHWTAWQIQDSTWQSHGAPIAEQFCDDLNEAYLRPALREIDYPGWEDVVIRYDAAEVVVNPDRSDDANEAFDREAIGYAAYRQMKNIPEDAAPTEEELLQMRSRNQSKTGPNQTAQAPTDAREVPEDGPDAVRGPAAPGAASVARELGAADLALLRCRELAGIRMLREKEKKCRECFQAVTADTALSRIPHIVGADALDRIGYADVRTLTIGGADGLRALLLDWGYSALQAGAFSEMVEIYASKTLFDARQPTLPAAFAAHLQGIQEAA